MSYSVHFPFSTFFSVSRHIPGPTVCVSHFSRFLGFLPYSKSYSVHFSFSMFCSVSCPIPDPKVSISHVPRFSMLLAIFQVLH
jgi:hypothetical protein